MQHGGRALIVWLTTAILIAAATYCRAQEPSTTEKKYKVEKGVMKEIIPVVDSAAKARADSLAAARTIPDSVKKQLSKREIRRQERALQDADTSFVRHSKIFRDSIPISRVCLYSAIAPGFGQLYNQQAWKIPILYGTAGLSLYGFIQQNRVYSGYKKEYDQLMRQNASRHLLEPVQQEMIQHNTARQIFLFTTLASYIYFIGDAAVNYSGYTSPVKKATTLSTICPGAGQIYNKSYWKVPVVLGGFATMAYIIDWNNRGYKRFKLAYDLVMDNDDSTVDEFNGRYSGDFLKNLKNSYRRNRDLCIILTGAFYLLNIIDAHVDAHLKDYDISDDLAVRLEPVVSNFYTLSGRRSNTVGLNLKINF